MRYEASLRVFQSAKTEAISAAGMPSAERITSYVSAMSCISPYSMPLWIILT
jgi:hypothetical protein